MKTPKQYMDELINAIKEKIAEENYGLAIKHSKVLINVLKLERDLNKSEEINENEIRNKE